MLWPECISYGGLDQGIQRYLPRFNDEVRVPPGFEFSTNIEVWVTGTL